MSTRLKKGLGVALFGALAATVGIAWFGAAVAAEDPAPPTVTMLGVEAPFFMMGSAIAGLAQETTGTWKATDGITNRTNYNITATVTGTTQMGAQPIVAVASLPDSDDDNTVYFTVSLRCVSGLVQSPDSSASVQISVTSNDTQLTGTHTFVANTFQDLDRP